MLRQNTSWSRYNCLVIYQNNALSQSKPSWNRNVASSNLRNFFLMKPLKIWVVWYELYFLQIHLLGNKYALLSARTTLCLYSIFCYAKIFTDFYFMPSPFILWNSFLPKRWTVLYLQVPYSQLSCALWICSKALFAAGTVDNGIVEGEWEKNSYMYGILWTLCKYENRIKCEWIVCSFVYSCMNTTILGRKKKPTQKNPQQSSLL